MFSPPQNLHAPAFPACEATRWQSSPAAARLWLRCSLASPWRCRTPSPDLSGPGNPQTPVSPLTPWMRDGWTDGAKLFQSWKKNLSAHVAPAGCGKSNMMLIKALCPQLSLFICFFLASSRNFTFLTSHQHTAVFRSVPPSLLANIHRLQEIKSRLHLPRWDPQRGCD